MRYLVFEFDAYYPGGGMYDCRLKTDNLEEALGRVRKSTYDYCEIYDTVEGVEISV